MITEADVVVVGAGPAGLSTAERIARAGLRTVLFEKNEAVGVPVRTSGGSFVSAMRELGVPPTCYQPLHLLRVITPRSETAFRYVDAVLCVLDVRGLYQWLAARAVEAGLTIRLKSQVTGPLLRDGRVCGVRVRDGLAGEYDVAARVVVDASGYAGLVAKRAGVHPGYKSFGFGVEYDLYAPHFDQDEAMLIMGGAVAPNGYAWAFPYGEGRVRLGTGVMRPQTDEDPRDYLDRLVERVPALARACRGASPIEYHTGLLPVLPPRGVPFVADGLVLVGDAAGQASNIAGEGIRFAMQSGRLAAEAIVAAVAAGDCSARALRRYEHAWERAFGRDLRVAYFLHQRLTRFSDEEWETHMDLMRRLSPGEFARVLKGDFSPRSVLAVAARHPGLLAGLARLFRPRRAPAG